MQAETIWSPEKIAQERIAIAALELIYEGETRPQGLQMLRGQGAPADVLALTTTTIIRQVIQKSRHELPDVCTAPALEILSELASLARALGVFDVENDIEVMKLARQRVIEKLTY